MTDLYKARDQADYLDDHYPGAAESLRELIHDVEVLERQKVEIVRDKTIFEHALNILMKSNHDGVGLAIKIAAEEYRCSQ